MTITRKRNSVFIVLAFLLSACVLPIDQFLPPGSNISPQAGQNATHSAPSISVDSATPETGQTYHPENTHSSPFPEAYIALGTWRCRVQPNLESNTDIFLHEGERVLVIFEYDRKWSYVQAGLKQCYVKSEGLVK